MKFDFKLTKKNGSTGIFQDYMNKRTYADQFTNEFLKIVPDNIRIVNEGAIIFSVISEDYVGALKNWHDFSEKYKSFAKEFAEEYGVDVTPRLFWYIEGEKNELEFKYNIVVPGKEKKEGLLKSYADFSKNDYLEFLDGLKKTIQTSSVDAKFEINKNGNTIDSFVLIESSEKDADMMVGVLKNKFTMYAGQFAVKKRLNIKKNLDIVYVDN